MPMTKNGLGVYRIANTPLHQLDPRIKLLALCVCVVGSFAARPPLGIAYMTALLAVALASSKTAPLTVVRALKPLTVVLIASLAANTLVVVGAPDVRLGAVGLSYAGALRGVWAVARMTLALGFVLVCSATTSATEVSAALTRVLKPLSKFGLDVDGFSMMVSIALRFIPITMEELDRIRTAQLIRSGATARRTVLSELKSWFSVLVPLVVSLFRRSEELARALSDRAFGAAPRTSLLSAPRACGWIVLGLVLAIVAAACIIL